MRRDPLKERTTKHPWRADDPDRIGTAWTVAADDGQLICCLDCGAPIEVLWEDIPALRLGHRIPVCAECEELDGRHIDPVFTVLHPPADVVAARHAAGDERRRHSYEQRRARRAA